MFSSRSPRVASMESQATKAVDSPPGQESRGYFAEALSERLRQEAQRQDSATPESQFGDESVEEDYKWRREVLNDCFDQSEVHKILLPTASIGESNVFTPWMRSNHFFRGGLYLSGEASHSLSREF